MKHVAETGKIKVIVFDYSGTLANDLQPVYKSHVGSLLLLKELELYNGYVPNFEEWINFAPRCISAWDTYEQLGIREHVPIATIFYSVIYEILSNDIKPYLYDGVEETLSSLKEKGLVLGVISAHPHKSLVREIEEFGIDKYFSFVCGSVSDKKKKLKEITEKFGVLPSNIVYVGDTNKDANAGKGAGVGIIVKKKGYVKDKFIDNKAKYFKKIDYPHILIEEFHELINHLEELEEMMQTYYDNSNPFETQQLENLDFIFNLD